MLELKNIRKQYNKNLVLEIPSLTLENDIYWIKGENGSGKTTLLKMIAGLLPFDGDISFKNINLKKDPLAYRKEISWAEAEPLFPSFLTGTDLISLYKNIRHASQQEIDILIETLNMRAFIQEATGTYSAGMNKKLSLLLAFLGNPSLIILDEPLITLDPHAFQRVCKLITERNKNNAVSFLMSSHQDPGTQLSASVKQLTVINKTIKSE